MKKILLLLMLFASAKCFAQNNNARLHFNLLSVKDGMPEGTVNDLLQDREGYIWIGTQKGLVRYDGYKLKVYDFGIKDPYGKVVLKIFEDNKGRLWALLLTGFLFVYNPAHDNFTSCIQLPQLQAVKYISEDASGNIWLSGNSLTQYDPVTKKSETFGNKEKGKHYLNAESFYQPVNDKAHRLWVSSSNGLYEYNAKEDVFIAHLSHKDSSKGIGISLIQEDAQHEGIFYMDTYKPYPFPSNEAFGRYNSNTDSLTLFHHSASDTNSIASDTISDFYTDSKGRLWISNFGGLSLFNASDQKFTNYFPEPANAFENTRVFITIKEDKAGNLWCNSEKGLYYLNINTKQFQQDTVDNNASNGLSDNLILNLFIDWSGSLWFGALNKGLQRIDTRRSKYIQYGNDASADIFFKGGAANSFTKAPDGSIWIGASNGLYHQTPDGNFKQVQFHAGNDVPARCFYDSKGLLWIGTSGKPGLYCYDPATGKAIDYSYVLKDTANSSFVGIRSICEDHLHDIWIGTWGNGIIRFNRKSSTFTGFPFIQNNNAIANTHGALDDDQVECIYEDKEGILWVGTNNGGLNRFNRDKGTFASYAGRAPGLICVININEDSKGRLWAGTYFGGLFELNKNRDSIKKFSEEDGLLYDGIWATEEDNKGNIWATTARGISIIDPSGQKITNIKNINNFNGPSAIKTEQGIFYFGTNDGFITLNPDDFAPDKEPPVVHIESLHLTTFISDKPKDSAIVVDGVKQYKFSYNENRITFNYVGLYYKDPLGTQYACKLDGYDKNWVQAGTQRTVTYTNLSPDTYTFHVKAMNSDGVWSKDESISFTITPPWWQTWLAYLLYAAAVAIIISSYVRYRSKQLTKRNKILEHKVTLRTAEVSEQKEELAAQRDNLEKALEDLQSTQSQLIQSEKMASLGELTAGIAHEIQNPLNFVNNFSDVNQELLAEMKEEMDKGNSDEAKVIANDVIENEQKINHHGKRADAIVKGMLQHSRKSSGQKEPTDINTLADEYLRLSYHGLRAKDKNFNATIDTDFDNSIGKVNIIPQDIGRVLLNLFNNAFYAVNEQKKQNPESYNPIVSLKTEKCDDKIYISVRDNGKGIPQNILDKIFQPFFTTKPTGEGTGLGLSLSYDIIKAQGGTLKVESTEGEGSEFIIMLPADLAVG
jgi:signal transduction histidine kinase/ligand-binding sensor domain-containing protein